MLKNHHTTGKQSDKLAKAWSDPVWSKVIAAGIIAVLSSAYLLISSLIRQISFKTLLDEQTEAITISIPRWIIFFGTVTVICVVLFVCLRKRKLRPKYFKVGTDQIAGPLYVRHHIVFHEDKINTVDELISSLRSSFEEDGLDKMVYGRDWYIFDWGREQPLKNHPGLKLKDLGIRGGSRLEIFKGRL
jgi:hypothetical protein